MVMPLSSIGQAAAYALTTLEVLRGEIKFEDKKSHFGVSLLCFGDDLVSES